MNWNEKWNSKTEDSISCVDIMLIRFEFKTVLPCINIARSPFLMWLVSDMKDFYNESFNCGIK